MMTTRRRLLALAAVALAVPVSVQAQAPRSVVATTAMVGDLAREIGGDRVSNRVLMGPGVDPHSYRQTRSDVAAMLSADLVLWNGLYLEAQLEEFLLELGGRKPVVAVGETLPEGRRLGSEDYAGRYDPHIWMDPLRWSAAIEGARDALIALDPEAEPLFRERADAYAAEASELDAYARGVLATVPEESRVLVTAHDAFNYFGDAYDFEVIGIQGISTESEAGLRRIETLVDLIVDRGVRAVFVESSVPERNVRALVEGAAARGHDVAIGGELFSDAMGEPGTYEGTWLGMIDHNVTTIARALGGDAPERGRLGRLAAGS